MERRFLAALDRFEEIRCSERVTATETAVFYRIAFAFRHAGYPREMAISTAELARQERLSTDMILVIRRRLEALGVIEYRPGTGRGNAARYVLDLPNDVPNDATNQPPNELPNDAANRCAMPIISAGGEGGCAAEGKGSGEIGSDKGGGIACARDEVLHTEDSINNININNPIPSEIEGFKGGKRRKSAKGAEEDARFAAFWAAYPRKVGKQAALKAWAKIAPSDGLVGQIMRGLEAAKGCRDWLKDGGAYIPHPSSWLNQARWEDEISVETKGETPRAQTEGRRPKYDVNY